MNSTENSAEEWARLGRECAQLARTLAGVGNLANAVTMRDNAKAWFECELALRKLLAGANKLDTTTHNPPI